jgi:hypothetical protein
MSELVRSLASRLREFVGNRRRAPRYAIRVPVTIELHDYINGKQRAVSRVVSTTGVTCDASVTGLGIIVPSIRIGGKYLTGEDRVIRVVIELPAGPVNLDCASVRYERLEDPDGTQRYLIGVHILNVEALNRLRWDQWVKALR